MSITTLKDITLDNIIDFILCNNKISCVDSNYTKTEEQLLLDIKERLDEQVSPSMIADITDYGDICREEGIHMGIKLGMKLMKELIKL